MIDEVLREFMASKGQLQTILMEKYGINKNISAALNKEECEQIIDILDSEPITVKLIESFAEKNAGLRKNNASLGSRRYHAETKLSSLQSEYLELQESIKNIELLKSESALRKQELEQETRKLEEDIKRITKENKNLKTKVNTLSSNNQELTEANSQLQKDNRHLKNIVDQIRLQLTINMNSLLRLQDSEIRKGLIKLLQSIQG